MTTLADINDALVNYGMRTFLNNTEPSPRITVYLRNSTDNQPENVAAYVTRTDKGFRVITTHRDETFDPALDIIDDIITTVSAEF